jgi:hypothetical protein
MYEGYWGWRHPILGFGTRKGREVKGDELRGVPRENKYRVVLLPKAPSSTALGLR